LQPLVSVVIPTRNRPLLVKRAVQSALAQTLKELEVIVVIDGSDEVTPVELAKIDEQRLRVIELPVSQGAADARNVGVSESAGEWIAFLDDDDEWLPQKLEVQLQAANCSNYAFPIVACCLIARTPKGEFIWPRRLPTPSEPLSEYLLARNSLFHGEGLIQTSVLFTKKDLLQNVPFTSGLQKHQDWDWLLRVSTWDGVGLEFVPEPLVIWYAEEQRKSISGKNNWRYSLDWIQKNRNLVTPRAYAAFIMTSVSMVAAREGDRKAFWPLLWEAMRSGQPKPIDFLLYAGMWLIPQNTRRQLRAVMQQVNQR
jgi:glycosyltransferase involved in cell wall biosynthesis